MDITSRVLMMGAGGAGGGDHWIADLAIPGDTMTLYGLAVDSTGAPAVCGVTATGTNIIVVKFNLNGSIAWQRNLIGSSNDYAFSLDFDSSNNLYVAGYTQSQGAGGSDGVLLKYNSAGTLQWQVARGANDSDGYYGISVDRATGDVYSAGQTVSLSVCWLISKTNSSGTTQWNRSYAASLNTADTAQKIAFGGSSVYVAGFVVNGFNDIYVTKYSSSGTLTWQRAIGTAGGDESPTGIAVSAAEDVYVVASTTSTGGAGGSDAYLVKWDSTGALQWQKSLGSAGGEQGLSVALDNGNPPFIPTAIYIGGTSGLIAKYDSNNGLTWQRTLVRTATGTNNIRGVAIGPNNTIYAMGSTGMLARLPADGSKTGTYDVFSYSVSSFTDSVRGLTESTPALSSNTVTLTDTTLTLTDSAGTMTSTVDSI